MNCYWALSSCIFEQNRIEEVKSIIKELNDDYLFFESDYINKDSEYYMPPSYEQAQSALTSLGCARKLGFYDKKLFNPTSYSKYLGEHWLNFNSRYVPFWMLKKEYGRQKELFNEFGGSMFVKPNSGYKLFTGLVLTPKNIDLEVSCMNISDDELVICSEEQNLYETEYRLFVVDRKIVTQASYSWNDETETNYVPLKVSFLAEEIIKNIDMDNYTIDFCQKWEDRDYVPKVVEINCIHTSGTYNCDLKKLLTSMHDYAIKEYDDWYN
jgi:hypothetical protein